MYQLRQTAQDSFLKIVQFPVKAIPFAVGGLYFLGAWAAQERCRAIGS